MGLQIPASLHVLDQAFQMVCPELVMLLTGMVNPAMGSEVAGWPRAPHEVVDMPPGRRAASRLFLGFYFRIPLCKHGSGGRRMLSLRASPQGGSSTAWLNVVQRQINSQLLSDS
ncbi:hypothetical protein PG999_005570 [Apiospora kogelbergensis]|uniref:Uncharacterized protein n=1 Tax=Apiospora kogelbergensis TaxID=1337665 RepID=A0AAW0R2G2_9PEZI